MGSSEAELPNRTVNGAMQLRSPFVIRVATLRCVLRKQFVPYLSLPHDILPRRRKYLSTNAYSRCAGGSIDD